MDATILALAGLKRLGRADVATSILEPHDFLPAVGQGAIALQAREDDEDTREALAAINHPATSIALAAELMETARLFAWIAYVVTLSVTLNLLALGAERRGDEE